MIDGVRLARTLVRQPAWDRYRVPTVGFTIVENEPSAPTSSSPAGAQSLPGLFDSSESASAPRATPVSEAAPPDP